MAVKLRFVIPAAIFARLGPLRLFAQANGFRLPERVYETAGEHVYRENCGRGDAWH